MRHIKQARLRCLTLLPSQRASSIQELWTLVLENWAPALVMGEVLMAAVKVFEGDPAGHSSIISVWPHCRRGGNGQCQELTVGFGGNLIASKAPRIDSSRLPQTQSSVFMIERRASKTSSDLCQRASATRSPAEETWSLAGSGKGRSNPAAQKLRGLTLSWAFACRPRTWTGGVKWLEALGDGRHNDCLHEDSDIVVRTGVRPWQRRALRN